MFLYLLLSAVNFKNLLRKYLISTNHKFLLIYKYIYVTRFLFSVDILNDSIKMKNSIILFLFILSFVALSNAIRRK